MPSAPSRAETRARSSAAPQARARGARPPALGASAGHVDPAGCPRRAALRGRSRGASGRSRTSPSPPGMIGARPAIGLLPVADGHRRYPTRIARPQRAPRELGLVASAATAAAALLPPAAAALAAAALVALAADEDVDAAAVGEEAARVRGEARREIGHASTYQSRRRPANFSSQSFPSGPRADRRRRAALRAPRLRRRRAARGARAPRRPRARAASTRCPGRRAPYDACCSHSTGRPRPSSRRRRDQRRARRAAPASALGAAR